MPDNRTPTDNVIKWVTSQSFNNVLLLVLVLTIIVGMKYLLDAIPSHISAIQQGYERIEQSHREERQASLEFFKELMPERQRYAGPVERKSP